jgi:2,5-furandicarboxylate decarboxylase 1
MSLREFLTKVEKEGRLVRIAREVNPYLEMARVIHALDGQPVLFEKVKGSDYRVVSGICSQRTHFALDLGVPPDRLLLVLAEAYAHPVPPEVVDAAPCQEIIERDVNLNRLPILTHIATDGGPYVTAGVAVIKDPELGRNVCFHRLMQLDEQRFTARIVEERGTYTAKSKVSGDLEIAICLGAPLPVLLAAATSPPKGVDELGIANALRPTPLVRCITKDLEVPADAEIVLEGRITRQTTAEGPFLDLTETWDIVRQQPVIEIDCITHRRDPIYQALLSGKLEHKILMGMPREPTIYAAVNEVCDCRNVYVTLGGMSWLHAVVQIAKRDADDGRRAAEAAFRGHNSLKHVVVVDDDVNPFDTRDVEWAIATRFQADRDLLVFEDQPGSSLDPSARHALGQKSRSTKMGLDATIPWRTRDGRLRSEAERAAFRRVAYEPIKVEEYVQAQDSTFR